MPRQSIEFKVATDLRELKHGVKKFNLAWEERPATMLALQLFRMSTHWLYDPNTGGFANVKFAGYSNMTLDLYVEARKAYGRGRHREKSRIEFVGEFTGAINKEIGRRFGEWRRDKELAKRLAKRIDELEGVGIADQLNHSKWRFLTLSKDGKRGSLPARANSFVHPTAMPPKFFAIEGGLRMRTHLSRERNRGLVLRLKAKWAEEDPLLRCEVCGMSFWEDYGTLGRGVIEAHHRDPLFKRQRATTTLQEDFSQVCPNCHTMLHCVGRSNEEMTVETLRKLRQERGLPVAKS